MKPQSLHLWAWIANITGAAMIVALIAFGYHAAERFRAVNAQWQAFTENYAQINSQLVQLRAEAGYGGFIHHFKNYVLRGEERHLGNAVADSIAIDVILGELGAALPTAEEREALETIAREADAVLRDGMRAEGLRESYPNITGYQLGIYAKTPRSSETMVSLHPGATWRFREGQVFHLYTTARGLALSETVEITAEGCRRLTSTPRRILVAGEDLAGGHQAPRP